MRFISNYKNKKKNTVLNEKERISRKAVTINLYIKYIHYWTSPEPTSHFVCGIAAAMKRGKTNGIYLSVFPKQYIYNSENAT